MKEKQENWGLLIKRLLPPPKRVISAEERRFRDRVVDMLDWMAEGYAWKRVSVAFGVDSIQLSYTKHGGHGITCVIINRASLGNASNKDLLKLHGAIVKADDAEDKVVLCKGKYVVAV